MFGVGSNFPNAQATIEAADPLTLSGTLQVQNIECVDDELTLLSPNNVQLMERVLADALGFRPFSAYNGAYNLGSNSSKFRDLYLSDNLYLSGQSVLVGKGTAFPGSPSDNDRFFRTDLRGGLEFYWDNDKGRWLGSVEHMLEFGQRQSVGYLGKQVIDDDGIDMWLTRWIVIINSAGINGSGDYLSITLQKMPYTGAADTVIDTTTNIGNAGGSIEVYHHNTNLSELLDTGTFACLRGEVVEVGDPDNYWVAMGAKYRLTTT